jgi:hypothetical protein
MFKFAEEQSLKAHAEKGSVLPLNVALWENGPWQPVLSIALALALSVEPLFSAILTVAV